MVAAPGRAGHAHDKAETMDAERIAREMRMAALPRQLAPQPRRRSAGRVRPVAGHGRRHQPRALLLRDHTAGDARRSRLELHAGRHAQHHQRRRLSHRIVSRPCQRPPARPENAVRRRVVADGDHGARNRVRARFRGRSRFSACSAGFLPRTSSSPAAFWPPASFRATRAGPHPPSPSISRAAASGC